MTLESIVVKIRNELIRSISGIDAWFDKETQLLDHRSTKQSKCARELLEDVMHTNRHLLRLIDSARMNTSTANLVYIAVEDYCLQTQILHDAASHEKFVSGEIRSIDRKPTLSEIRNEIRDQLDRCLIHLELLLAGEAPIFKTKLAIGDLREMDVYHTIYFLAVHTRRYLGELDEILLDFNQTSEKRLTFKASAV
ncbi:MAG: hypothetical protein ABJA70_08775 [Chryseolinea sp.]